MVYIFSFLTMVLDTARENLFAHKMFTLTNCALLDTIYDSNGTLGYRVFELWEVDTIRAEMTQM